MLSAEYGGDRCKITISLAIAIWAALSSKIQGQIVGDHTANTQVQTDDNISVITGGIESGANLFHSFEQFSLATDAIADFDHSSEIEHIFSRITGGQVSEIDGLLQTQGEASLFLLNPAGVIFGANARLDVGGSLIVMTGDSLIFADGTEFSAVDPEIEPLLTVSTPIGLQYGQAGKIEISANSNRDLINPNLSISPGNTLALLGGDVSVSQNSLDAVGSNVEIASIKSGAIALQYDTLGWQFAYSDVLDSGKIDFSDRALINSSGRVNFWGKTISFSAGSGVLDFEQLSSTKNVINLQAQEAINIDAALLITQVGLNDSTVEDSLNISGGDIFIEAPQVTVSNGSIVSAGTLSEGAGGSITINAQDWLKLLGSELNSERSNPSIISTSSEGIGKGGQIDINTGKLTIRDGSQIQALAGEGAGGTIWVDATDSIELSGTGIWQSQNAPETELASGFSASSGVAGLPLEEQSGGASGSLVINTPQLTINQEAQISVSNHGLEDAGDIEIKTSRLNLDSKGSIIANTALGEGGSINIAAAQWIILDRASSISTAAQNGDGGNITLETENLALLDANQISANANQGNGGSITINTQGLFIDPNSSITASSAVEQNQGEVEIFTLDLNSRLTTDYIEQSALIATDQVTSGCGVGINLNPNQIRDIGRGGVPSNPFREVASTETLGDWGAENPDSSEINRTNQPLATVIEQPADSSVVEIDSWVINTQGVIELVAAPAQNATLSHCQAKN
ncbi:MAG: filamentous hemagglutinin N-terminal domain-containing protein [Cyanobacteria bacterium P01_C01_bin.72]